MSDSRGQSQKPEAETRNAIVELAVTELAIRRQDTVSNGVITCPRPTSRALSGWRQCITS